MNGCADELIDVYIDGRIGMNGRTDRWMSRWIDTLTDGWLDGRVDG